MKEEIWNKLYLYLITIEIGVFKNFKECARSPCNGNHFSSKVSSCFFFFYGSFFFSPEVPGLSVAILLGSVPTKSLFHARERDSSLISSHAFAHMQGSI